MNQAAPPPTYYVSPAQKDFVPDAVWEKKQWSGVPVGKIDRFPWHKGGWTPCTEFKLQYTQDYIYVIFQVQDQYVRCINTEYGSGVCNDACVEFFFQPAPEKSSLYFNIETNCGGTMLFNSQTGRLENTLTIPQEQASLLEVAASMPLTVDPEIPEPLVWTLEYRVPLSVLEKHAEVVRPAPGVAWRANFFKCAVNNSHVHYGCWSPVGTPRPDYHQPQYFGTLTFR